MEIRFRRLLTPIILLFLYSCVPAAVSPTPTTFTPIITLQATRLTPTQTVSTTDPSSIENHQCDHDGNLERYQIDSVLLNGPLFFTVYFPPCYDSEFKGGYPVLYALHGQNFNDDMWVDLGMADIADDLIANGEVSPFMVVMPFEEHFFRGAEVNNFPVALKEEIIIWIEDTFNVCAEKSCRAIGGISRGASWAMRIGLTEWDFFGAVGAHSLPTFCGDITNMSDWLERIPYGEEPRIHMDTGRFDPEIKNSYRFEQVLSEKGIPHEWQLNEGRHNEAYWSEHMEEYLRWYSDAWK